MRHDKKKNPVLLPGVILLLIGLLQFYACNSESGNVVIGREAPNFSYFDLAGESRELKELKGKVVLLRFWADWCPYCDAEMPIIDKLYREMKGKSFTVLAVNVKQSKATAKAYIEKFKLSFPVALDREGKIAELYDVKGLPMNFLINKKGILKDLLIGAISDEQMLREFLEPYIS